MNIALIIAGGVGKRTGYDVPKQFISIREKPILIYTLEAFEKHPMIDEICIVCLIGWKEVVKAYARQFHISKLKWIADSGETGQESIFNGISLLKEHYSSEDAVFIHDAVRPLISNEVLNNLISTFNNHGSGVTAIPCTEAVLRSADGIQSQESIPRDQLFRTQTPQVYTLSKLIWAHNEAAKLGIRNSVSTCTLMSELGETIYLSPGAERNMKITTDSDISMISALLEI